MPFCILRSTCYIIMLGNQAKKLNKYGCVHWWTVVVSCIMVSSRRRSVCDVSGFSRRSIGRPYISILVYVRAGASLYLSMVLLLLWSDQLISMSTVHSDFTVIWHIVFSAIGWHICGNLEQPEKHKHTCVVRKPFWGCRSPFRIHKCLVALRSFFKNLHMEGVTRNDTTIPRPCQC
jgi:hypothetical protein